MMTTRHAVAGTELGEITLVADGGDLVGVYFPHHWYAPPRAAFGPAVALADDPLLAAAGQQLARYLRGESTGFELPTRTSGSPFEERVWTLLGEIPYGQTTSYGALAGQLGDRALAQEVGRAVGRNPLSVIVPCHRVLG